MGDGVIRGTDTVNVVPFSAVAVAGNHDFQSLHYLSPEHQHSIVYGNLKYPAFVIKKDGSQSNILYGSCRKLHGEGQDTLALAELLKMSIKT